MWYQHAVFQKLILIGYSIVFCLFGLSSSCLAASKIQDLQVSQQKDATEVRIKISGKQPYKVFTLSNPDRIVIDVEQSRWHVKLDPNALQATPIQKIRHSENEKGTVRIVLDMQKATPVSQHHFEPTSVKEQQMLVLQLGAKKGKESSKEKKPDQKVTKNETKKPQKTIAKATKSAGVFVVAIDPGHGGEDTGAIGQKYKLREKDIVLSVSKKLQAMINKEPNMRAFLIRNGDYYISLRKRIAIAREQGADLFISVHADAFEDPRASGASVFVLSEKGASNEAARWLAEKENRSDLIGGVSLEDKGSILASVLLDLSQTASQSASYELGNHIIKHLGNTTDLHHKTVQSAGFAVLKSPDIPSVLVELGFISNYEGEKRLQEPAHQKALASAILSGVKAYSSKRPFIAPPQDPMLAKKSNITVSSKN